MSPLKLEIGQEAKVLGIRSDEELRSRLYSLGLSRGSILKIESVTLLRGTYAIRVDDTTTLALRKEELEKIEVNPLA